VDWTKLKLKTAVIATAAAPHARTFNPLFIKVFMIVSLSRGGWADLHHAGRRRLAHGSPQAWCYI
jgi:hypothetical protein